MTPPLASGISGMFADRGRASGRALRGEARSSCRGGRRSRPSKRAPLSPRRPSRLGCGSRLGVRRRMAAPGEKNDARASLRRRCGASARRLRRRGGEDGRPRRTVRHLERLHVRARPTPGLAPPQAAAGLAQGRGPTLQRRRMPRPRRVPAPRGAACAALRAPRTPRRRGGRARRAGGLRRARREAARGARGDAAAPRRARRPRRAARGPR